MNLIIKVLCISSLFTYSAFLCNIVLNIIGGIKDCNIPVYLHSFWFIKKSLFSMFNFEYLINECIYFLLIRLCFDFSTYMLFSFVNCEFKYICFNTLVWEMMLFRSIDESLLYIFIIFSFLEDKYSISTFTNIIFHIFNNYLIFKRQFLKDKMLVSRCMWIFLLLLDHVVRKFR